MASVYQRGDTWWVRHNDGGKYIRVSTGLKKKEKAERFLNIWLPLYQECQRLGLQIKPSEGLFQMAKRIESAWIRIERLMAKMRDHGFLLS